MKIKKKIAVWCALFALLAALVPPSSARANTTETTADDVKYTDIEEFMHGAGYLDFKKNEGSFYFCVKQSDYIYIYELAGYLDCEPFVALKANSDYVYFFCEASIGEYKRYEYQYYNFEKASLHDNYNCLNYVEKTFTNSKMNTDQYYYNDLYNYYLYFGPCVADSILYCDLDIYNVKPESGYFYESRDSLWFEKTVKSTYDFPLWCEDAGLNCLASTNESATVIPYSYNSYWHIVRKTSSGKWLLTTVGSNLGQAKMSLRLTEDNSKLMIYEFSGDDTVVMNVRQYEYDLDGWKVRTYETYDYDDLTNGLVTLEAGSGIDSTRMIAYTSTPIYSADGLSVSVPVSSEYYEVEMPSIPEQEVTPTPTVVPSGGVSNNGTMITYKPALSGKVSASSLNMRKEASADSEIVASFIKTWSLTLHGFVNTPDGVVWYFCTAERDGIIYTGYVMSEYVEIVGSSGSSGSDSESTLDEKLAEALKELEALAIFVARVPMIIGIIFSFMPSWCLVLFGFAFGFLVLKAIVSR